MASDFGRRLKNLSSSARWLIAIGGALMLLLVSASCSLVGYFMSGFAANACNSLPGWLEFYFFLPPTLIVIGALLAPILFGLRKRWPWIIGSLVASWGLGLLLYIAWVPLVTAQC